jgi:hypothetical protein
MALATPLIAALELLVAGIYLRTSSTTSVITSLTTMTIPTPITASFAMRTIIISAKHMTIGKAFSMSSS